MKMAMNHGTPLKSMAMNHGTPLKSRTSSCLEKKSNNTDPRFAKSGKVKFKRNWNNGIPLIPGRKYERKPSDGLKVDENGNIQGERKPDQKESNITRNESIIKYDTSYISTATEIKTKCRCTIALWNIRGNFNDKREIFLEIRERNAIDIFCLTETKLKGQGLERYPRYLLHKSGVSANQRAKEGVAAIIGDRFRHEICPFYYNQRIMWLHLRKHTVIVIAYAPNNSSPRKERNKFWKQLEKCMTAFGSKKIVLAGDFNAWLDVRKRVPNVLGNFGDDRTNHNGKMFMKLCRRKRMFISNTFFKNENMHTWAIKNKKESMIDFIAYSISMENSVENTEVKIEENCGSDHRLVVSRFNF